MQTQTERGNAPAEHQQQGRQGRPTLDQPNRTFGPRPESWGRRTSQARRKERRQGRPPAGLLHTCHLQLQSFASHWTTMRPPLSRAATAVPLVIVCSHSATPGCEPCGLARAAVKKSPKATANACSSSVVTPRQARCEHHRLIFTTASYVLLSRHQGRAGEVGDLLRVRARSYGAALPRLCKSRSSNECSVRNIHGKRKVSETALQRLFGSRETRD